MSKDRHYTALVKKAKNPSPARNSGMFSGNGSQKQDGGKVKHKSLLPKLDNGGSKTKAALKKAVKGR